MRFIKLYRKMPEEQKIEIIDDNDDHQIYLGKVSEIRLLRENDRKMLYKLKVLDIMTTTLSKDIIVIYTIKAREDF